MIKWESTTGMIKTAMFMGSVEDLCADVALLVSTCYGSIARVNEDAAGAFKYALCQGFADKDFTDSLFTREVADSLRESNHYDGIEMAFNENGIAEQLAEVLKAKKDNEDQ